MPEGILALSIILGEEYNLVWAQDRSDRFNTSNRSGAEGLVDMVPVLTVLSAAHRQSGGYAGDVALAFRSSRVAG